MNYIKMLAEAHRQIEPRLYTEIGVRRGRSLAVSRTRSYGIDPGFQITEEINAEVRLFKMTSDDFFLRSDVATLFAQPTEMAFIDGMHLFEFALRDFINVEHTCTNRSVVFFDDIFPRVAEEAVRDKRLRTTNAWTGDIWKIIPCLRQYRPDLLLLPIDALPTGLLMVCNLNPEDQTLQMRYDEIARRFNSEAFSDPPLEMLTREGSINPRKLVRSGFMRSVASAAGDSSLREAYEALRRTEGVQ